MHSKSQTKRSSTQSTQADCKNLRVLIPYRDRKEHLDTLLPRLQEVLPQNSQITIVEQSDAGHFNKGALLNAGVKEIHADYYCFHDVDFYPLKVSYAYPLRPTRPFSITLGHKDYTEKFNHRKLERLLQGEGSDQEVRATVYPDCFGGVILVRQDHFIKVNGFSNRYPFWGYEDLDFRVRCEREGLDPIMDPNGEFRLLPHPHVVQEKPECKQQILENEARFQQNLFDEGLSDVQYEVVERKSYQNFDWLSIHTF